MYSGIIHDFTYINTRYLSFEVFLKQYWRISRRIPSCPLTRFAYASCAWCNTQRYLPVVASLGQRASILPQRHFLGFESRTYSVHPYLFPSQLDNL